MNFGIDDHAQGIKGIFSTIISTLNRATFNAHNIPIATSKYTTFPC